MKARSIVTALALVIAPMPGAAETRALVLGVESYAGAASIRLGGALEETSAALTEAGFRVLTAADQDADGLRERLAQMLETPVPERLVILLAGHFAHSAGQTWFLGTDADRPGLATADGMGLPLSTVMEVAAISPGGALVLLGTEDRRSALGAGLSAGIGRIDPPQGVTVIHGEIGRVIDLAEAAAADPARSLPELLENRDLTARGFLSPLLPFAPAETRPAAADPAEHVRAAEEGAEQAADRAAWQQAQEAGTTAAFEAYLGRFPDGRFAAEARAGIERIAADPERIEDELNLGRTQRREIQQRLSLLGFDTRGIDGLFGPGSRSAIAAWQAGRGLPETGFLTAAQIDLLGRDAALREAEIAEQERRDREARDAADRAFWRDTGAGGDEAALNAYLARFPEGQFAEVARGRLAEIDDRRDRAAWDRARDADTAAAYRGYLDTRPQGSFADTARTRLREMQAAEDRAAWDRAEGDDTAGAYHAYLEAFPDGRFAERARARIAERDPQPAPPPQSDPAGEETALGLNFFDRNLIEAQLGLFGFNPGRIDGNWDDDTRRAIAAYQQSRGLPASGFVTRDTLRRMQSDGLPIARD